MSATMSPTRVRLQRLLDERTTLTKLHEDLIASAEKREEDRGLTDVEAEQAQNYKTRSVKVDEEITELYEVLEREEKAASTSKIVRAHLAGEGPGVTTENGQTKYRTFAAYARDEMITRFPKIEKLVDRAAKENARERLLRAPQHTLSSDVDGLIPPQHIAQILDIIDKGRPVVASANRVNLERGSITYPKINQRPEVLLQESEKTEGGTAKMDISMETLNAESFIGGGNLSWQAINWSTPDALQLWFNLAGEAYARQTEGTACAVLTAAGTAGAIGTASPPLLGTASTFAQWLSAVVAGFEAVYANSNERAMPDTLYLSPDMFFLAAALTSDSGAMLINQGGLSLAGLGGNIAGIRVVTSYGFGTSTAIVGDSRAFLVAETAGAPVELRAVEPAIGGLEVGVIGAFAAVSVDNNRFASIA